MRRGGCERLKEKERNEGKGEADIDENVDMIRLLRDRLEDRLDAFFGGDIALDAAVPSRGKEGLAPSSASSATHLPARLGSPAKTGLTHPTYLPLSFFSISSVSLNESTVLPTPKTVAPFETRAQAMSLPRPEPPPVMTMTREETSKREVGENWGKEDMLW